MQIWNDKSEYDHPQIIRDFEDKVFSLLLHYQTRSQSGTLLSKLHV